MCVENSAKKHFVRFHLHTCMSVEGEDQQKANLCLIDYNSHILQTLPPRFLMTESDVDRCVGEGETCLFRGGLVGAAVKLNCCPGSKCVFYGNSFSCVANR